MKILLLIALMFSIPAVAQDTPKNATPSTKQAAQADRQAAAEKKTTCNNDATERKLKGAERRKFVRNCVKA